MDYINSDLPSILDALKKKLRIAVVYAGDKKIRGNVYNITPNIRSWKSYEFVAHDIANALREIGFVHTIVLPESVHLLSDIKKCKIDFVWLNTAGVQGYSSMAHAPSLLELAGIPYVGHNPLTAALLDDKHSFKGGLVAFGIPTLRWFTWDMMRGDFRPEINSRFNEVFGDYSGPFVIKPVSGRASLNVEIADTVCDIPNVVKSVFHKTNYHVLIEEYISGDEYCVSVCGRVCSKQGKIATLSHPFVFSEMKRVLEKDERIFTSMDIKPITHQRARLLDNTDPQDARVINRLQKIAHAIYLDFSLQTLVRVDIRAKKNGQLYVLETNPKPDLKNFSSESVSLVAMGLHKQNMTYVDLITSLLANRLDNLFSYHQENIKHVIDLL